VAFAVANCFVFAEVKGKLKLKISGNDLPPPLALSVVSLALAGCLEISINDTIIIAQAPQQVPHRARDDAGLRRRRGSVDRPVGLRRG